MAVDVGSDAEILLSCQVSSMAPTSYLHYLKRMCPFVIPVFCFSSPTSNAAFLIQSFSCQSQNNHDKLGLYVTDNYSTYVQISRHVKAFPCYCGANLFPPPRPTVAFPHILQLIETTFQVEIAV